MGHESDIKESIEIGAFLHFFYVFVSVFEWKLHLVVELNVCVYPPVLPG